MKYPQSIGDMNTVFQVQFFFFIFIVIKSETLMYLIGFYQVNPDGFVVVWSRIHGEVLKSSNLLRNWECKKISEQKYEVKF